MKGGEEEEREGREEEKGGRRENKGGIEKDSKLVWEGGEGEVC